MDAEPLFSALVREFLFVLLYRAGAESLTSEHAARLSAMQAAERNIDAHLAEMRVVYQQLRQQGITEELIDVVSGFMVLKRRGASDTRRDGGRLAGT
jgi:F-type H+-transporting ATPase subunit gamma